MDGLRVPLGGQGLGQRAARIWAAVTASGLRWPRSKVIVTVSSDCRSASAGVRAVPALFGLGEHPDSEEIIAAYLKEHVRAGMSERQLERVQHEAIAAARWAGASLPTMRWRSSTRGSGRGWR
jgi:hypothetical protein